MADLIRFLEAQAGRDAGFDVALAEIRAGRKQGHWIWYVFPQLRGLGSSPTARFYGLDDAEESIAYLGNDTLRSRLLQMTTAANEQLSHGVQLRNLMGSDIDALKVVSCMTLFRAIAARLQEEPGAWPEIAALGREADTLLQAARAQGYDACNRTLAQLEAPGTGQR